jgi:hypothetical protein
LILDKEESTERAIGITGVELQTTLPFQTAAMKAKQYQGDVLNKK